MLLTHLDDGLLALTEAAAGSRVRLTPVLACTAAADPAEEVRRDAHALLTAWLHRPGVVGAPVAVADARLAADLLAGAGAIEVCVHGWDVATACGVDRPIPTALAADLLDLVPLTVCADDRPVRFAAALPVPDTAPPGDRLLAALGRPAPRGNLLPG